MSLIGDICMYGRFALGLPGFLRNKETLEDAKAIVRRRKVVILSIGWLGRP